MSVAEIIAARGIREVLHFTTNTGLLGMLASGAVLSRARLPAQSYLEHVYKPNAAVRKDANWLDYVNLSISRINTEFFGHASRWHRDRDVWWCVLSLDPALLEHGGVVFATTNNIYTGVRRGEGPSGLEALFSPTVTRWSGNTAKRAGGIAASHPTCHQAEVLYPGALSIDLLRRVYVLTEEHADIVGAQIEILVEGGEVSGAGAQIPIDVRPDAFGY